VTTGEGMGVFSLACLQPNKLNNSNMNNTFLNSLYIMQVSQEIDVLFLDELPNGLRYLRVGGRGQCLGAEKT